MPRLPSRIDQGRCPSSTAARCRIDSGSPALRGVPMRGLISRTAPALTSPPVPGKGCGAKRSPPASSGWPSTSHDCGSRRAAGRCRAPTRRAPAVRPRAPAFRPQEQINGQDARAVRNGGRRPIRRLLVVAHAGGGDDVDPFGGETDRDAVVVTVAAAIQPLVEGRLQQPLAADQRRAEPVDGRSKERRAEIRDDRPAGA